MHELEFRANLDIVAMHSKEGESVPLVRSLNPGNAAGAVERWLREFESVMKDTVLEQCGKSMKAYTQVARAEWTVDWPGQVVLTVNQVHWAQGVARAIQRGKNGLNEFLDKSNAELQYIVMKVRGDLSYLQRCTLGALVVIDVHARDVVEHLIANQVTDVGNFDWQSQLRYYWEEDQVKVRMINAQIDYGCEYLGNSDRLVITALTDRCYRTLMGALQLNLGGAPEGPAGTFAQQQQPAAARRLLPLSRRILIFLCVFFFPFFLSICRLLQERERRRRRRILRRLARSSAWCSTVPTVWTTWPWASSSRAWRPRAPGHASTSSTA